MSGQRGPRHTPGPGGARVPEIAAGADDREQMHSLYNATGAAAFGLALRVLHRRGAAEEVVREGYRRARLARWTFDEDEPEIVPAAPEPAPPPPRPGPDLGTPWGRAAFAATGVRSDLLPYGAMDVAFGSGVVYAPKEPGPPESRHDDEPPEPDEFAAARTPLDRDPLAVPADHSWLLAQIHRLAVQRLRLDRRDDDVPWLAAAARLGFDDPLDSRCEVFVLAYYGGRTYRAISRELGMRVPMVTRLLADGIERLAEQRIIGWPGKQSWSPPGSVLSVADAYALDAVAELEHHHIENKLSATAPNSLSQFAARVRGVHEMLALLAVDDEHAPPRALETRILADIGTDPPPRRGPWVATPPWLRRFHT
ncbi:RskA family anti-sigma factor [Nocardia lasii]|uniref:Anti-sigma-K factor RskA N-terminal domain-containing protein n=1 Tax=Nocardia lasii TaxID=1616107 RepID=A0ABW1JUP0_9NOCA